MKILFTISLITLGFWGGFRGVAALRFHQNCGGYIERAGQANSVETAKDDLRRAILYLEENKLTSGFTSVMYRTPDEDVGFFYNNLAAGYEELNNLPETATGLEKSNVLLKLRETLILPQGISIYPYNAIMGVVSSVCFFFVAIFVIVISKGECLEILFIPFLIFDN